MESACGGLPEQRAAGRSMVPGKWDSGIHLFLLAEEGISGAERTPGGDLRRGAGHGAYPALRAYRSSHGGKRCADPGLRGSGYLEDGRLELSNNRAERSIKPFVMGRKNWLFSNTPAGAQSSAVIYSLIETAKENDLDPYRYLVWLLNTAPGLSQMDEAWAESFLPVNAPQECKIPK